MGFWRTETTRAIAVAAGCALLGAACAAPKAPGPVLLHPLPPTRDRYTLSEGAAVYEGKDFTVSVRPWDWRLVEDDYECRNEVNPFGGVESAEGLVFFRVRLRNHSGRILQFDPFRTSLRADGGGPRAPLEYSDFLMLADDPDAAAARAESFHRTAYDGAVALRGGEEVERYLVFPVPGSDGQSFLLEVDELYLGSESFDLVFPFEAFPGK